MFTVANSKKAAGVLKKDDDHLILEQWNWLATMCFAPRD